MRRMHRVLSVPFLFSHYKCRSFLHFDWFPVTLTNRINNVACCAVCPTWVKECEHIIKQKKHCFVWRSSHCTVTQREWDPWTGIVWMTALIRVCPPLAKGKKKSNVWFYPFTQLPQWTVLSSASPPTWQRPEVARPPWWPTFLTQPCLKTITKHLLM